MRKFIAVTWIITNRIMCICIRNMRIVDWESLSIISFKRGG